MKAQELRIGNFIKDRGGKILSIDRFCGNKIEMDVKGMPSSENVIPLCYHPLTEEISYCQPIPLTEEWLLKIKGYKKWNAFGESYGGYLRLGKFGTIMLRFLNGRFYYWIATIHPDEKYWKTLMELCVSCPYVHTLQNLIFALTGEELCLQSEQK